MKSLSFLMIILTLFSATSFAGQVGEFQVQSCSLIVPRSASQEMLSDLIAKGYRPMNLIGGTQNLQDTKDLMGFPYLEDNSFFIRIVGESKALYPVDQAPNCIDPLEN